jgi:predicted DNA-binding ribbon-helix-helix protein
MKSPIVKHSVVLAGHKTSVSLEDEFWNALKEVAGGRNITLTDLVDAIDAQRQHNNLSSALRLFVLEYYCSKAAEKVKVLGEQSVPPTPVIS